METLWLWVLSSEVAIIILLLITLVHLKLSTPAEVCVEGSASTVLSTPPAEATLEVIPDQQLSHAMKTIRELVSEDQLLDAGLLLMRLLLIVRLSVDDAPAIPSNILIRVHAVVIRRCCF